MRKNFALYNSMCEKTFDYKGKKVRYLEAGEGQLIVMLHGWGANADLFERSLEFVSRKYHVVAPDMPGFGKSEEPDAPYDLNDYADFAVAFVRYVLKKTKSLKDGDEASKPVQSTSETKNPVQDEKNEQCEAYANRHDVILLGHSHGGRTLLRLMSRAAKGEDFGFEIEKAILTDSAGIVPEKTDEQKKRTAEYKRYKSLLTKTGIAKIAPSLMDKLQKKYGSADYAAASPIMRQSMVKVVNTDLRDEMPLIKIPVLLIWGDADTATPIADGREMEKLIPEAGLAVIHGGTHFCFLEYPELYNAILGSFLGI